MEEQFRLIASYPALALECLAALMVSFGAIEALWILAKSAAGRVGDGRRRAWLGFAGWILLALEFALGADLIRTAIAPTWDSIGMLGAIAVIRTILGFFLGRDLEEARALAPDRVDDVQGSPRAR